LERDVPAPGQEMQAYSSRLMEQGMKSGDPYFFDLAKRFTASPRAPEEFTLSPGQARFRGSERVAELPPLPQEPKGAKPTFGMDYDKTLLGRFTGRSFRELGPQAEINWFRLNGRKVERLKDKPERIPFAGTAAESHLAEAHPGAEAAGFEDCSS
jgi:hypothetical protein